MRERLRQRIRFVERRSALLVPRRSAARIRAPDAGGGRDSSPPTVAARALIRHAAATWATGTTLTAQLSGYLRSIAPKQRGRAVGNELTRLTRGELYQEARARAIPGRSKMDRRELLEAVSRTQREDWLAKIVDRCHAGVASLSLGTGAVKRVTLFAGSGRLLSGFRTPRLAGHILPAVGELTQRRRTVLLAAVVTLCGGLGLLVAMSFAPEGEGGTPVRRVQNGVTETGKVETVTTPRGVKRVIRWRTRAGRIVTETVRGQLRITTLEGETFYLAGPSHTVFGTTTLPTGTVVVTGPGVTSIATLPVTTVETLPVTVIVRETVTETATDTVTETLIETVRDTVTVTDTVTEVVTETVTLPTP